MLEAAFGFESGSWWKHAQGLLPVVVGNRMSKLWCWGDEDELVVSMLEMNTSAVYGGPFQRTE